MGSRITTIGVNRKGIASDQTVTPPDSTGSIGPRHYIEMVNAQVGVYNRNLKLLAQIDLDNFVGKPADSQCDPQIQWDQQGKHWLYVAIDCDGGTPNFLLFGWSKDASPLPLPVMGGGAGNWCRFQINTGGDLDDYPKLGHSNKHFIIGTNVFNPGFATSRIWVVEKPAKGDASCTVPTATFFGSPGATLLTADGDFAFTPVPANLINGGGKGFVTAADFGTGNQLMVWKVTGTGAAPVLTQLGNIGVPGYTFPSNVPQPGTANLLDSSDTRLTQSVGAKDPDAGNKTAVWTQHTVDGTGGRSEVRWYEIIPDNCGGGICPASARRQRGTIKSGNHFIFNGAVSPTRAGNRAGIQYNRGSATKRAQILAQTRRGTDPLSTMSGQVRLANSQASDNDFSCSPCRWGDYSALNPDPRNTTTLWGTNMTNGPQIGGGAPHWATRNFSIDP